MLRAFGFAACVVGVLVGLLMLWGVVPRPAVLASSPLPVLTWVQWVNALLGFGVALVALGAANRMSAHTELTIKISFATVGAGAIGYAASSVWPEGWQHICDTVLIGGILALLIGTRRQTIWIPPEWMPRLSMGVSVATWAIFFGGMR